MLFHHIRTIYPQEGSAETNVCKYITQDRKSEAKWMHSTVLSSSLRLTHTLALDQSVQQTQDTHVDRSGHDTAAEGSKLKNLSQNAIDPREGDQTKGKVDDINSTINTRLLRHNREGEYASPWVTPTRANACGSFLANRTRPTAALLPLNSQQQQRA